MASDDTRSLRALLKEATADQHDALDESMGATPLQEDGYAAFLAVQYAAREPLERWARESCPADLCPPEQTHLIADDLAQLGHANPPALTFSPPHAARWQGLAWALGGSSLGNKAMLVQKRKAGRAGPTAFLSDPAMTAYFRRLLPVLERPVEPDVADGSIRAALAVFECFESALAQRGTRLAA